MALRLTGRACWRVGQKQALARPSNTGHPSLRHRLGSRYICIVKGTPRAGLRARGESLWSRSLASSSPTDSPPDPPASLSPAMHFLSDRGYHGEIAKVGLSLLYLSTRLPVRLSVCLSMCLLIMATMGISPILASACPQPACLSACLPACLSACRGYHGDIAKVGLPVCLPVCWPAWLSTCLLACLSYRLSF
jgi:hypothetical protein